LYQSSESKELIRLLEITSFKLEKLPRAFSFKSLFSKAFCNLSNHFSTFLNHSSGVIFIVAFPFSKLILFLF
jgi:hypothetical protein